MIGKGGVPIRSMDQWLRRAGPKSPVQWQDHRSAKECARAWLEAAEGDSPGIPAELLDVLRSHEHFGVIGAWEAEPEAQVRFDAYGGPANIDMMLSARDGRGGSVVAVEAKADESFGPLVSRALSQALERRLRNPSSRGLDRIEALAAALLPPAANGRPPLHRIRYQLLTATAAALARAVEAGADRAVVLVHEFRTPRTDAERLRRNARDLVAFARRIGFTEPDAVLDGRLVGPLRVAGGGRFRDPPPFYIGKALRRMPTEHG